MPNSRARNFLLAAAASAALLPATENITSFVDNNGIQHIVYQASNNHINQLYYSGGWVNQDLTVYGGTPVTQTPITSWVDQSGAYHIAYMSTAFHINQLFFGTYWVSQDITQMAGGRQVYAFYPISSWVDHAGAQHIAYSDGTPHINQMLYTSSGWGNQDLTQLGGGQTPQYDSLNMPSWVDSSGAQHIVYEDSGSHINQLIYSGGTSWGNQILSNYGGSPVSESGLAALIDKNGQRIAYFNSGSYPYALNQLWWNGSNWINQNLSALSGSAGGAGSSITSFIDSAGGLHYAYLDASSDVNVLTSYGGNSWSNQNVTAIAGGSPDYRSALTSYVDRSGGLHIAYVSTNEHVNQLWWTGSTWVNQDLTSYVNGPPAWF